MGLNLSWIGVRGEQRSALLDRLGLEEIGETGNEVGVDYACTDLPDGWLVLVATDHAFDLKRALSNASSNGFAVGCEMSETVMVSEALAFQGASLLWSVVHDPNRNPHGVAVEGVPPPQFEEIRTRLQIQQMVSENVDHRQLPWRCMSSPTSCGIRGVEKNWQAGSTSRPGRSNA